MASTDISMTVTALLTGASLPFRGEEASAIRKRPVAGPVRVGRLGLDGDMQADPVFHGGLDKAIHLYAQDHYAFWRDRRPGHALLEGPGAFGENIASLGLTEAGLCIGDRFTLGTAVVEVSHGRQPCWKLDHHFGGPGIMLAMVQTGHSGVYFRVIEEGVAEAGTDMRLIERVRPEWTVARVFRLLVAGGAAEDPAGVEELAAMPELALAWRLRAEKLAARL